MYRIEDAYEQLPVGKRYDKKTVSLEGDVPVLDQSHAGILGYHSDAPGIEASPEAPVVTFANHTCAMRLVKSPFSVIQNVFPLIGKSGICDTRFLYYASQGRQTEEYKGHHPAWRRSARPSCRTQIRIADVLGSLDDLIENNRRRIELLEEMAQAIYREWFVHFRFLLRNRNLYRLTDRPHPRKLEFQTLEQLAHLTMGQSPKSEFYNESGEGHPFIKGSRFWPAFPYSSHVLHRRGKAGEIRRHLDQRSSTRRTVEHSALRSHHWPRFGLARARSGAQALLFYGLKMTAFAVEDSIGSGTIFKAITKSDLANLRIPWPTSEIESQASSVLDSMMDQIRALTSWNTGLSSTRELLLPKLVSGEIDVSDLDLDAVLEGAV